MRDLITGGAGFIGSHLVDAYLNRGDEVLVLDDLSSGKMTNLDHPDSKKFKFLKFDIRSENLEQIVQEFKPDLISHHAAQKSVKDSVSDPFNDSSINITGTIRLLEACRKMNQPRILFASSGGTVYGVQDFFPADETHPLRPVAPYAVSKVSAEFYLNYYCSEWGFSATVLRYGNVYGPRQDPKGEAGVVAIFCEALLKSAPCKIFGDGTQTRDFIYIDDIVSANLAAEKTLKGFQIFNVCSDSEANVQKIYALVDGAAGAGRKPIYEDARKGDLHRVGISSKAFQSKTGWKPKVSLAEGINSTWKWFKTC